MWFRFLHSETSNSTKLNCFWWFYSGSLNLIYILLYSKSDVLRCTPTINFMEGLFKCPQCTERPLTEFWRPFFFFAQHMKSKHWNIQTVWNIWQTRKILHVNFQCSRMLAREDTPSTYLQEKKILWISQ